MSPAGPGSLILHIRERKDGTMRKLVVSTFLTLDGVMQAPGGPSEDTDGGFTLGGWSVNYWDDRMVEVMAEATSKPFAMVLGRKSYDILAAHWPHASEEEGAPIFNNATKYVASRGRPTLEWENSVLLEGDAAEALAQLKREDGPELQVVGSSDLIQSLLRAGIVDEYRLWIFPLVIGSGKKLFGDGTLPAGLELVDSTLSTTGRRDGDVRARRRGRPGVVRARVVGYARVQSASVPSGVRTARPCSTSSARRSAAAARSGIGSDPSARSSATSPVVSPPGKKSRSGSGDSGGGTRSRSGAKFASRVS